MATIRRKRRATARQPGFAFEVVDPGAQAVVEACQQALLEHFDQVSIKPRRPYQRPRRQVDGFLEVRGPAGHRRFAFEAKTHLTAQTVRLAAQQAKNHSAAERADPLVLSEYVNDNVAQYLRGQGIQYIDAAGNAYLQTPDLHVWFRGGKPQRPRTAEAATLQAAGLQLLALLFVAPDAANWPYRRIAETAGIALGSVSHGMAALRAAGHLHLAAPRRKVLAGGAALFEKWEFGYVARLRPTLRPRVFRLADGASVNQVPNRLAAMTDVSVLIGGEWVVALKTGHLRAERVTIHVPRGDMLQPLAKALKLVPDANGNVDVIEHFGAGDVWRWPDAGPAALAHPILVHAEASRNAADDRVREATRDLFDRYIAPTLHEPSVH